MVMGEPEASKEGDAFAIYSPIMNSVSAGTPTFVFGFMRMDF